MLIIVCCLRARPLSGRLFCSSLTVLLCCRSVCSYSELALFTSSVQRLLNFNRSPSVGQFRMARAEQEILPRSFEVGRAAIHIASGFYPHICVKMYSDEHLCVHTQLLLQLRLSCADLFKISKRPI